MLLGEVADEIDRLNGRPDSVGRCLAAVDEYLREMTEANHRALVEAFHAVPAHRRLHTGDVDRKDQPLQALVTEVGELLPDGRMLTEEMREEAVDYFRRRARAVARWEAHVPADGPEEATRAPVAIGETAFPQDWPAEPGRHVLQNEYPAPITVDGRTYRSVLHAYWTLSTPDPVWQDRIAAAYRDWDAARLAEQAPRDPRWPQVRLAVMARLLRAKYTQHPEHARVLRETGDARLSYLGMESRYWNSSGTNWVGRLLELVRAELAAGER
jgi:predicted NAD-dependent protein-ADP-ribosyltransferase YbiA (DUF1768 family)